MAIRDDKGTRQLDFHSYKTAGRDWEPPDNLDDTSEIIKMSLEAMKETKGSRAAYPDTPEGRELFYQKSVEYFQRIVDVNTENAGNENRKLLIPDFEGWAAYLNISRITLYNYSNRNREWFELIDNFRNVIISVKKQMTATFRTPPMWAIFDLVNNSDYRNTNEIKVSTEQTQQQITDMQTQDTLSSAGLIYDAHSGEYIPMIGTTEGGEDI